MQAKAEKLAKKYKALYESKNIPDSYFLWVGGIGTDSPVFCVVSFGKSAEDFFAQEGKHTKLLGEEVKELNLKAVGIEIEEKYCEIAVRRLGQEVLPFKSNQTLELTTQLS